MTDLFENERIDDLEINDLRLIQNAEGYCFTSDSVLLANLVKARKTDKILDVGAGSGIISILLAGKMGMAKDHGGYISVIKLSISFIVEESL